MVVDTELKSKPFSVVFTNNFMTRQSSLTQWLIMIGVISSGVLLFPILFATTFISKLLILLCLSLGLVGILAVRAILSNKISLVITPITGALLAVAATTAASIFFTQPYPTAGLFGLGGFILWSAIAGLLLTALLQPEAEAAEDNGQLMSWNTKFQFKILVSLGLVCIILAITGALEQIGIGPARWINAILGVKLPTDLRFSLAGSPLAAAQLGGLTLIGWLVLGWQQKRWAPMTVSFIIGAALTLFLNIWAMLPNHISNIILPQWSVSWSLILDTLRTPKTALIGFGTENYGTTLTKFKPAWVNGTPNWQFSFGTASNWPFTLLVTQGVLGFIAWLWLVIAAHKIGSDSSHQLLPLLAILGLSLLIQLVLPLQVTTLFIQILILAILVSGNPSASQIIHFKPKHWWPVAIGWVMVAMIFGTGWYYSKLISAYHHMFLADKAAFKNEPVKLYDEQRLAVLSSPYLDQIRRQYSVTNLQLALALSSNKNITEADKTQITQLVSQAIREAKAATIIDPTNSQNWIALAEIYRNLATANKDANQWTISALVSAIGTDPTNPTLRLDLGQILLDQNLLADASQTFNQAIELKPDLPGGYFQLGRVFKVTNQLDKTQILWQKALSLLPTTSEEYRAVDTNLKEISAAIAATVSAKKTQVPVTTPDAVSSEMATESALLRLTKDSSQKVLKENLPVSGQNPIDPTNKLTTPLDSGTPTTQP
jgi:tetratricopeptide (TPR) repeat protein